MRRRIVIAGTSGLVVLVVLVGCAFAAPPRPVDDSRVVAASPRLVLDRARRWLVAHRFEIEKAQKQRDGGRVVASQSPFREAGYARCAWMFRISGGAEPAARVTVIAAAEHVGEHRVTAKVDIALVNTFGDRAQCASHGTLEQKILAAVAAK
jgi:hypothetical protein